MTKEQCTLGALNKNVSDKYDLLLPMFETVSCVCRNIAGITSFSLFFFL